MSTIAFIAAYTLLACIYLYTHRPATGKAAPPRAKRIHRVTDLRLGCEHPTRDNHGRFISKRAAAHQIQDAVVWCSATSAWPTFYPEGYVTDRGTLYTMIAPQHMPAYPLSDDYSWSAEDVDLAYERYLDSHNNHPDALSDLEYAIARAADEARLDAQFQAWLDANPLAASSHLEDEDTIH